MSDAPLRDVPQDQGARPQQQGGFATMPAAAPQTGYQNPAYMPQDPYSPQQQGLTLEGIQQVMTQTLTNYDAQLQRQRAEELQAVLNQANENAERIRQGLDDHISGVLDAVGVTQAELNRMRVAQEDTRAKPEPQEPVQGLPAPSRGDHPQVRQLANVGDSPTVYPIDPVVEAKQEAKAMAFTKKEPVAIVGAIITIAAVVANQYGMNFTDSEIDSVQTGISLAISAVIAIIGTIGTVYGRSRVNSPATEHIRDAKRAEQVVTTLKLSGVEVPESLENKAIRKAVR